MSETEIGLQSSKDVIEKARNVLSERLYWLRVRKALERAKLTGEYQLVGKVPEVEEGNIRLYRGVTPKGIPKEMRTTSEKDKNRYFELISMEPAG